MADSQKMYQRILYSLKRLVKLDSRKFSFQNKYSNVIEIATTILAKFHCKEVFSTSWWSETFWTKINIGSINIVWMNFNRHIVSTVLHIIFSKMSIGIIKNPFIEYDIYKSSNFGKTFLQMKVARLFNMIIIHSFKTQLPEYDMDFFVKNELNEKNAHKGTWKTIALSWISSQSVSLCSIWYQVIQEEPNQDSKAI